MSRAEDILKNRRITEKVPQWAQKIQTYVDALSEDRFAPFHDELQLFVEDYVKINIEYVRLVCKMQKDSTVLYKKFRDFRDRVDDFIPAFKKLEKKLNADSVAASKLEKLLDKRK